MGLLPKNPFSTIIRRTHIQICIVCTNCMHVTFQANEKETGKTTNSLLDLYTHNNSSIFSGVSSRYLASLP
jgi:hypothetical protein